jgi:hypothetical protein
MVLTPIFSQNKVLIRGAAMYSPGTVIGVEKFEDYFTRKTIQIAQTVLSGDSTFEISLNINEIDKFKITVNQDYCYLYAQPGGEYKIFITNKRTRNFNNPLGNELEVSLLDLPKEDINYKILAFDAWYERFMAENYHLRVKKDHTFAKKLFEFENRVAQTYQSDTNQFFKTYVKYRVASIEDLNFVGARSERARFTVNLAPFTVYYRSEEYMSYVRSFYKNFFESLAPELNNKVYKAILAGSPTRLINLLSKDYRVANVRLRELVMIISLADIYHDKNYPQSRINIILDSISKNGLFKENQVIAKNTLEKLKQLNPGSPSPKYEFIDFYGNTFDVKSFQPKYTYIQFINLEQSNSLLQLEMLKNLYCKYNTSIDFITVVMNDVDWSIINEKININEIPWTVAKPKNHREVIGQFQLVAYPYYVLIDAQGYITQSPAASPVPDGSYKTIDYYFYEIQKVMSRSKK